MTAGEFVRRVQALGAARGVPVRFDSTRGKGSHGTLYFQLNSIDRRAAKGIKRINRKFKNG